MSELKEAVEKLSKAARALAEHDHNEGIDAVDTHVTYFKKYYQINRWYLKQSDEK